jgi:hypothetical protein
VQLLRPHSIFVQSKFVGQSAFVAQVLGTHRCPAEQCVPILQSASAMHPGMHSEPPQLHGGGLQIVVGSCIAHSESIVHGFGGS